MKLYYVQHYIGRVGLRIDYVVAIEGEEEKHYDVTLLCKERDTAIINPFENYQCYETPDNVFYEFVEEGMLHQEWGETKKKGVFTAKVFLPYNGSARLFIKSRRVSDIDAYVEKVNGY